MKKWTKRCLVSLLLLGLVVSVPALSGCNSKKDNKNKEGFKEENLNPSNVQLAPLTGPGGTAAPTDEKTQ